MKGFSLKHQLLFLNGAFRCHWDHHASRARAHYQEVLHKPPQQGQRGAIFSFPRTILRATKARTREGADRDDHKQDELGSPLCFTNLHV